MSDGEGSSGSMMAANLARTLGHVRTSGLRVCVLEHAQSTQDEALARSGGRGGWVVVTLDQRGGRGRLGRIWQPTAGMGVAMTVTMDEQGADGAGVSLRGGLAALWACERLTGTGTLAIRWPNDVVERDGQERKIAGVLVERREGVLLLGIGVNVLQRTEDWPAELRSRATSIAAMRGDGTDVDPVFAAAALLESVERALAEPLASVVTAWNERNALAARVRSFVHDGRTWTGLVEAIDPLSQITLRLDSGERIRLPALTTSLVHEAS